MSSFACGPSMRAIVARELGPPSVLTLEDVPVPVPLDGQVLVKLAAIGVNFSETERRRGTYLRPNLPWIPGSEGAGVVWRAGPGVDASMIGQRVAFWAMPPAVSGTYAEFAVAPAASLFWLESQLTFEQAAALPLQGLTAYLLVHGAAQVHAGHTVLIHAAGGGLGLIATQLCRRLGARVLGTVSNAAKREAVQEVGGEPLEYGDDLAARVSNATGGRGVDVVLDSVGVATQQVSLQVLAPFGRLIHYGDASGSPAPIDPEQLYERSLMVGAFGLDLDHAPETAAQARRDLVQWAADGSLQIKIAATLPLHDAAEAHRRLESRQVAGKLLLLP